MAREWHTNGQPFPYQGDPYWLDDPDEEDRKPETPKPDLRPVVQRYKEREKWPKK